MARCANCGRRITPDADPPLCGKCAACETMYEAMMLRLKRRLFVSIRSCLICLPIACVLYFARPFQAATVLGMALFYYAIANVVLSGAQCLSQFIQLRRQRRKEQPEETK